MAELFEVPWGSESICYWCVKNGKCEMFQPDVLMDWGRGKVSWQFLLSMGSVSNCPINGFEPDYSKLPEQFRGRKIMEREKVVEAKLNV